MNENSSISKYKREPGDGFISVNCFGYLSGRMSTTAKIEWLDGLLGGEHDWNFG